MFTTVILVAVVGFPSWGSDPQSATSAPEAIALMSLHHHNYFHTLLGGALFSAAQRAAHLLYSPIGMNSPEIGAAQLVLGFSKVSI